MEKIGIFYGTSSGNTEYVAKLLADQLDVSSIFDVAHIDVSKLEEFDLLIFGSSTLGWGDLQDDWYDFLEKVKTVNLSGKKVAVFGLGDSATYSETFCDAIGLIATAAEGIGASLVGNSVDAADYEFDESSAVADGVFCGLPLDEDNESDKTEERVERWIKQLKESL